MTESVESDKHLVPESASSDQDRNFAQLRASREQLAKEKTELAAEKARLERENAELRANTSESRFLSEAGVDPESTWMETKHIPSIVSAIEKRVEQKAKAQIEEELKRYKSANVHSYMMAETAGDYGRVVNEENVKKAVEQNPHLMMAFEALSHDPTKHAQFAYQACKQVNDQERRAAEIKAKAEQTVRPSYMPPIDHYSTDYSPPKTDLFKKGDLSIIERINRPQD